VSGLDDYAASGDEPDHELLRRAAGSEQSDDEISPYRYGPPVSPHLGAEMAREEIDPVRLRRAAARAASGADTLVVEGVGGLLVPLTIGYLVRDFARDLGLPLVIAASPGLGTINHTLLTIEAARAVGLEPAAVVLTPWPNRPTRVDRSNRVVIERLGAVHVDVLKELDLSHPESWPALEVPAPETRPASRETAQR
jgi:dethiobiotin synthetase